MQKQNAETRRRADSIARATAAAAPSSRDQFIYRDFADILKQKTVLPIRQRSQEVSLVSGAKSQDWIRVALARTKTPLAQKVLATQNTDPFVHQGTTSCLIVHAAAPA